MLLRESLGNVNCRTTMIAHISAAAGSYAETLSTIQIAARVLRMKKKKTKVRSSQGARWMKELSEACPGPEAERAESVFLMPSTRGVVEGGCQHVAPCPPRGRKTFGPIEKNSTSPPHS